jgi:hypothetical protein
MKIALNALKPYNYMFMCKEAKVHLSIAKPIGVIDKITPSVQRGLDSGKIILIEGPIKEEKVQEEVSLQEDVKEENKPVKPQTKSSRKINVKK